MELSMSSNAKKVLITGALGHIGSALIRNLGKDIDREVIILDSLEGRRFPSLYGLPKEFKFKFINADIRKVDFGKYLSGIDAVIHLAAITNAEESLSSPKKVEAVNYTGLKKVADACLANGVKLLFPSTTSVYGSQSSRVDETCRELLPQSPYAESKLKSEKYLEKLGRKGLDYIICRFGTIYGYSVGMRYDTAVNKFSWQAANGEPITVWKTARRQKRPYLYLNDCIRAINFIIEKDLFNRQIYNVLTQNLTVEDIIEAIKRIIPTLAIDFVDSPIMNQLSYEVDDAKFRTLGFKPAGDLQTGIKSTFDQLSGIIKEA